MAHASVVLGGEQEADAEFVQAMARLRRAHVELDAHLVEQIARARLARYRAVAMLGHFQAAGGGDQRRGGGNVDGVEAIATGTDYVAKLVVWTREVARFRQQRFGGASDLLRCLSLDLEGGQ